MADSKESRIDTFKTSKLCSLSTTPNTESKSKANNEDQKMAKSDDKQQLAMCITIEDVYDVAAAIGKDFECIIEQFGPDAVVNLMPKVISVLEELEDYATRFDTKDREVQMLRAAVERLETEKIERIEDQTKYEQELELLEDTWRSESQELLQLIGKLSKDNSQLNELVKAKEVNSNVAPQKITSNVTTDSEEIQLMVRLKDIIDRQKLEIRNLRRQVSQRSVDLDAMQQQVDRLAKLNAELRRKHCVNKRQSDQLIEDKTNLELQLQAKEKLVSEMRDHIIYSNGQDHTKQVKSQFISGDDSVMASDTHSSGIGHSDIDRNTTGIGISVSPSMTTSMTTDFGSCTNPLDHLTEDQLIARLNFEGKMIIDNQNPDRPRFTMDELRTVLYERNELKSRLVEIEEELNVYKRAGDDDPPVQGPINREPYEKMDDSERSIRGSNIRQLFNLLRRKVNR